MSCSYFINWQDITIKAFSNPVSWSLPIYVHTATWFTLSRVCGSCVADIVSREKMAVKKGIVVNPRVMGFVNLCKGIGTLYKVGNSYLARLGEISSIIKKTLWESIDVILAVEAATVGLSDIVYFTGTRTN